MDLRLFSGMVGRSYRKSGFGSSISTSATESIPYKVFVNFTPSADGMGDRGPTKLDFTVTVTIGSISSNGMVRSVYSQPYDWISSGASKVIATGTVPVGQAQSFVDHSTIDGVTISQLYKKQNKASDKMVRRTVTWRVYTNNPVKDPQGVIRSYTLNAEIMSTTLN